MKIENILLIIIILCISSCSDDFLNRPSQSSLTTSVYFKTQEDFEAAVNGIYSPLMSFFNNQHRGNTYSPANLTIGDMHSDNARYLYNPDYRAVGANETAADFIPDNQLFSGYWNNFYVWISRANQVLALIDDATFEKSILDNLKGEALFLRALSYWWLTQLYGDVCIHLEPVTTLEGTSVPLSSRAEVINQIVSDATLASTILFNKQNQQPGRVTSGTAKMLLAEVAIWEKDYPKAESILKSLSTEYSLMPNYADVFDPNLKNNSESIFEIQYSGASATYASNFFYGMLPYPMDKADIEELTGVNNATSLAEGEGYNIPSPELLASYESNDERYNVTVKYITNAKGITVPVCVKYLHKHSLFFQADENLPMWRYAEALLYLAEAINEQPEGRQTEALQYINQVRSRAGLPSITGAFTQADLRVIILQERRVELAFEGKRFWDLVRYDILEETITEYGKSIRANPTDYYLPEGIVPVPSAFTDFRTKFNIPDSEKLYNPYIN